MDTKTNTQKKPNQEQDMLSLDASMLEADWSMTGPKCEQPLMDLLC